MAESEVDVPAVLREIENAVRNHQSRSPTGKVMVEGPSGLLCPEPPGTIELSEEFVGFGIDGKHGIPRLEILALEIVDLFRRSYVPLHGATANLVTGNFTSLTSLPHRRTEPATGVLCLWCRRK